VNGGDDARRRASLQALRGLVAAEDGHGPSTDRVRLRGVPAGPGGRAACTVFAHRPAEDLRAVWCSGGREDEHDEVLFVSGWYIVIVAFATSKAIVLSDLLDGLRALQAGGTVLPPETLRAAAELEQLLDAMRRETVPVPPGVPAVDPGTRVRSPSEERASMDVMAVAKVLGCSPRNVRGLAERGSLPGSKGRGGRWAFRRVDVMAYAGRGA